MQLAKFHHRTSRGPSQAVSSSSPPNWSHGTLPHSAAGIPLPRDAIYGYPDLYADDQRHRHLYVLYRARLRQKRLGRHLLSACPVADTGRIARRPGADPTERQDAAPREGHGVHQIRGLPRMVRKDSRRPAAAGGKPPRQAQSSGAAKGCSATSPAPHHRTGPAAAPRILVARPPAPASTPGKPVHHVPVRPR